jgi:formamidopyrimidine-DNA glycosylase
MPELPDVTLYVEALARDFGGKPLERARLASVSLLRSVDPPLSAAEGRKVAGARRIGKRVVLSLEGDLHLVFHLMIAGRFHVKKRGAPIPAKRAHAAFDFPDATLMLTEASPKKRAMLHVVQGEANLAAHDPGGIEPLACDLAAFRAALLRESHTLKRSLTDPTLFSGIGNAYSDEILHRAKLSPMKLSTKLDDAESAALYDATRTVLVEWTDRLRREFDGAFPEKVTAFRPEMAVHGKYREPCPVCGAPVQRIVHAANESNYCAHCQTGGKLLADRALSRLLKDDWPRTLEELEARLPQRATPKAR